MRRILIATILVLSVSVGTAAVAISPAAAQGNETADPDDEEETPEPPSLEITDGQAAPEEEPASQSIDDNLNLMSWEYNDDREGFELEFETERRTQITITEAVQFSEGSGSGRIYQTRIPSGPSEVFVPVQRRGGQAAVTMVTPASLSENRYAYVSTGEAAPDRPALDYERVQFMVLLTAGLAAGGTLGIFAWRREDESRDYERIL